MQSWVTPSADTARDSRPGGAHALGPVASRRTGRFTRLALPPGSLRGLSPVPPPDRFAVLPWDIGREGERLVVHSFFGDLL